MIDNKLPAHIVARNALDIGNCHSVGSVNITRRAQLYLPVPERIAGPLIEYLWQHRKQSYWNIMRTASDSSFWQLRCSEATYDCAFAFIRGMLAAEAIALEVELRETLQERV